MEPDLVALHDDRQRHAQDAALAPPQLTWVGHATALLQLGGLSVVMLERQAVARGQTLVFYGAAGAGRGCILACCA